MNTPREALEHLLDSMRPFLKAAGVPANQINVCAGKHKTDTVGKAFDWLHDLYMHPDYAHHVWVNGLVAPERWKYYRLHGITGLQEQVLLAKSSKLVRAIWKTKRPTIFRRDKVENHQKKT